MWLDTVLPRAIARFRDVCPGVELRRLAASDADLHRGGVDPGERLPAFLRRECFVDLTCLLTPLHGTQSDPLRDYSHHGVALS